MKIGDAEKEKALFSILKRARTEHLEPAFIRHFRNQIAFKWIRAIYGTNVLAGLYGELMAENLLEYKAGFYRLTDKGKLVLKRGYIHIKVSKYASPEYSFCISILALAVSILDSAWFWSFIHYIRRAIEEFCQLRLSK